jgi:nucleotide-binding universal stress UspA family protein
MFENILIPLDGSELASSILPLVEELAWTHKSSVVMLAVVRPPHTTEYTRSEDLMALNQQSLEVLRRDAEAYLAARKGEWRPEGIPVKTKVIASSSVASTILDYAEANGIDMIAMSTHGRSGLGRWVYGSVADKVLQHAICPVLLIRSRQDG